ncbi:MAG: sulfatase [Akkermansiaceae bacterium]|nr:sulfatase [Akkermansiaceae bacterium]
MIILQSVVFGLLAIGSSAGAGADEAHLEVSVSDRYVDPGAEIEVRWTARGFDSLTLEPGGIDLSKLGKDGMGGMTMKVLETTVYTLTAKQGNEEVRKSIRVAVGPPRPNLVFFLVDDMGWQDCSVPFHHDAAGNPVISELNRRYRTPHMEKLAEGGLRFSRAYAHPVCTPSRIAWLTGKNPARHHVTNWTSPDGSETGDQDLEHLRSPREWRRKGIARGETTLPGVLSEAGYRTIHCGKGHFGSRGSYGQFPTALGFDVNIAGCEIGHPGSYSGDYGQSTSRAVPGLEAYHHKDVHLTDALTKELLREISSAVEEGVPFFASMAHYAVHSPFQEDARFAANYPGMTGPERAYATLIEGMDRSLGDIMAGLEKLGVAEDTLIVFLSDNGGDAPMARGNAPLRAKKGWAYEGGIRVPMIASWARRDSTNAFQKSVPIPAAGIEDDLVHISDIFPTFLALARCGPVESADGHDLSAYLRGEAGEHRPQRLVIHFPHNHNDRFFSVLHEGTWKLIYRYEDGSQELYQLATDLGETRDLAATEPERVRRMTATLEAELKEMGAQFPWNLKTGAEEKIRPIPEP